MSFKIVQTKEPGRKAPSLSIVPSAWEKDGTLYWPPARKKGLLPKLIKDGNSRPEADWVPQPCTRKRQIFLSYEAADLELIAMEQKSDSEAEYRELPQKRPIRKRTDNEPEEELLPKKRLTIQKRTEVGRVPQANLNFLAEECKKATELLGIENTRQFFNNMEQEDSENLNVQSQFTGMPINKKSGNILQQYTSNVSQNLATIKVVEDQKKPQLFSASQQQLKVVPSQCYNILKKNTANAVQDRNLSSSRIVNFDKDKELPYEFVEQGNANEQINLFVNNLNTIMQNQSELLENQLRIIEQLANQETMIEQICQQLASNKDKASTSHESDKATTSKEATLDPLPINSLTKLEQFEMELLDEVYMDKLVKCKSHICGTSGKMNGLNCSYRLVDCFFERQLLLRFSWSGGSRYNEGKMAFKKYKNIMTLFYKIIRKADSQYTETACQNFFKSVIKNAKRRFELAKNCTERRRASSGKKRPNNLNYKKNKDNETDNQEIDADGNTEEAGENKTIGENETVVENEAVEENEVANEENEEADEENEEPLVIIVATEAEDGEFSD